MKNITLSTISVLCFLAYGNVSASVYQCEAPGHNGPVPVEVTVGNQGNIEKVAVGKNQETVGIADAAIKILPEKIVKGQTLALDALTGASYTSRAILTATEDCLKKAGIDTKPLLVKKDQSKAVKNIKKEADVVIVGAGGAGMSAAVAASEAGAKVLLLEKTASIGGNTMRAGGGYNFADPVLQSKLAITGPQIETLKQILAEQPKNPLQAELIETVKKQFQAYKDKKDTSVFDSPEFHALQTWKAGDYQASLPLVLELCKLSPENAKKLTAMGFKWNPRVSTYIGALWPRSHDASNYKSGFGFIQTYQNTIKDKNLPVEYLMQTTAKELIKENGKVVGVKAVDADGNNVEVRAKKGVILTTGGFGANPEMRVKYDKLWDGRLDAKFPTTNSPAITGDGICMGEKAGANLVGMDYIQLLAGDPETGVTSTLVGMSTSMYVNKEGKRYVNELERRDVLMKAALAQPEGTFWWITTQKNGQIDANNKNKYGLDVESLIKSGAVYRSDTIGGLCKFIGCDPKVLEETVAKWRQASKDQKDPEFGRNAINPDVYIDEGPYYAVKRKPSVHHTMGGLQINTKAQVLDKNGNVIPGLWAAGEVTGGIHGTNRVGANAIPDALSFGRVAAQSVLSQK